MPPIINKDTCNLCGICCDICPQDVFAFDNQDPPRVKYPDECWYCGACVIDCPVDAIHLKLPLQMQIVPSPARYGSPGTQEAEALRKAAAFSRSVIKEK